MCPDAGLLDKALAAAAAAERSAASSLPVELPIEDATPWDDATRCYAPDMYRAETVRLPTFACFLSTPVRQEPPGTVNMAASQAGHIAPTMSWAADTSPNHLMPAGNSGTGRATAFTRPNHEKRPPVSTQDGQEEQHCPCRLKSSQVTEHSCSCSRQVVAATLTRVAAQPRHPIPAARHASGTARVEAWMNSNEGTTSASLYPCCPSSSTFLIIAAAEHKLVEQSW